MKHNGNTLSWTRGRLLNSYGSNSYTYNVNGIRTSKTAGGITKTFILDGDRLIAEKWSDDTAIYYVYNENGIAGFVYNGIPYVYQKNVFGDIVAIYNNAGGKVAGYRYNAYGECYIYNPELTANSNGSTIAEINPFRYRGYYYDTESGLYYLQSRYYDPAMGRFLNADTVDYLEPETINGVNLYAYSLNNPIQYYDPTGHFWGFVIKVAAGAIVGAIVGGLMASRNGDDVLTAVIIGGISGAASAALGGFASSLVKQKLIGSFAASTFEAVGNFAIGAMANVASQKYLKGRNPNNYDAGETYIAGGLSALFSLVQKGIDKKIEARNLTQFSEEFQKNISKLFVGMANSWLENALNSIRCKN